MNRLLATAAVLVALSAPSLALAQDHDHERGGGGGRPAAPQAPAPHQAQPQFQGPQGGGRPQFQGGPGGQRPQFQGGPFQGGQPGFQHPQGVPQPQGRPQFQGGQPGFQGQPTFQGRPQPQGQGFQGQPGFQGRPQGGFDRDGRDHGGFDRGGFDRGGFHGARPGGQQFSIGGRSFFRYRAEPYRYPNGYRGWSNHYWRRGEFLPSFFFLPNYYIDDYYAFGLWEPGYGYEWIRVGADALLVNMATGEVVDVVPGVYYY